MKKMICAAALALMAAFAMPAAAQQAGVKQPAGHSMKVLNQQPLTLTEAKKAVDALIELRTKYKDAKFKGRADGPAGVVEGMKQSALRDKILADLKTYGFSSIDEWVGKFVSVGMAVSYVQRNGEGNLQKKISDIRNNPNMPDRLKQQLLAMLTALIPPKGNAEVAKQLLADPVYAKKISKLIKRRSPPPPPPGMKPVKPAN